MGALAALGAAAALVLAGCVSTGRSVPPPVAARTSTGTVPTSASWAAPATPHPSSRPVVPRPDHVVVAVLENHAYDELIGSSNAPFINSLGTSGALFTQSYAVAHPSQPNYLALFSGSTQGIANDSCPHTFTTPNLGRELLDAGLTFAGYSQDLPAVGFTGCSSGVYARKHNPWVDFRDLPAAVNQPFTAFPSSFAALPTLSFVIPNLDYDMHDGTVAQADQWLHGNLGGYADWAGRHNSLLILTCDEDDYSQDNRIVTIVAGAHVQPGRYGERIDHNRLLRTVQDAYGLPALGASAAVTPVTDIWRTG